MYGWDLPGYPKFWNSLWMYRPKDARYTLDTLWMYTYQKDTKYTSYVLERKLQDTLQTPDFTNLTQLSSYSQYTPTRIIILEVTCIYPYFLSKSYLESVRKCLYRIIKWWCHSFCVHSPVRSENYSLTMVGISTQTKVPFKNNESFFSFNDMRL